MASIDCMKSSTFIVEIRIVRKSKSNKTFKKKKSKNMKKIINELLLKRQ